MAPTFNGTEIVLVNVTTAMMGRKAAMQFPDQTNKS
jgi:hypothetical protein